MKKPKTDPNKKYEDKEIHEYDNMPEPIRIRTPNGLVVYCEGYEYRDRREDENKGC